MSARRLDAGGRIDRARPLRFSWDGRTLSGYAGDTLASALLANGVRVVGRSFKYHRPRGVGSAGVDETGALVTLGRGARRDPNVLATMQPLYHGLVARGQNAWPSVRFDLGAVNGLLGRFFSAGFYYKTFMGLPPFEWGRGTGYWMGYEKLIRRAAGMGRASREPDPDRYEHAHGFCDVLVVGAGPAGLEAWLVEQDHLPGGGYLNEADDAPRRAAHDAATAAGVRIMTRTTAFGLYDHGSVGLFERLGDGADGGLGVPAAAPRQRFWKLRTRHVILTTGALERGLAFADNDRPGVIGAAAARTYLHRFGVRVGKRIVVATSNDSGYRSALDLAAAGARLSVLDARAAVPEPLRAACARYDIDLYAGHAPLRARGALSALSAAVDDGGGRWRYGPTLACDSVLVAGGWSPALHLLSQRGVRPRWDERLGCFVAPEHDEPITLAGAAAGVWGHDACIASGARAGRRAARALGVDLPPEADADRAADREADAGAPARTLYEVRVPGSGGKTFIDPQHDVTAEDVRQATREGYVSVEHLKRYTTLGMAVDQGKAGNVLGLGLLADARGADVGAIGTTTFRPPYTPVALGALAGRHVQQHFKPLRRTPLHGWNLARGATLTEAGLWQRPWYYPREGEDLAAAYVREAAAVRETVGLCDVTTLGKIAVQGPDAGVFLDRVYVNRVGTLKIGRTRYGVMLRDDGVVFDDGTVWRLGEAEFFITTTTAHAAAVLVWLEELLQCRWPALRVHVTSVTEQWAGCAVAGPRSRELLEACVDVPAQVSNDALPFMGIADVTIAGLACRIARISFSGERAYEVYTPSDYGAALMESLWAAAAPLGGCLYGLEALAALRIEKGHVTGAELDGRVTLDDAGLGRMARTDGGYIGAALRGREALAAADRPRLVGLWPRERTQTFNAGALLCAAGEVSGHGVGWVTAVTHSPALGHWIGLGFIRGGVGSWRGRAAVAADPVRGRSTAVEIVAPVMVDPGGERLRG